jgi:hypothetical protein
MCILTTDLALEPEADTETLLFSLKGIVLLKVDGADIADFKQDLMGLASRIRREKNQELTTWWCAAMLLAGYPLNVIDAILR